MKFIIALVLLAAVVGVYTQKISIGANAGIGGGAKGGKPPNLPKSMKSVQDLVSNE